MDAALVFLLCLFIGSLEATCPPKEDVWPCQCTPSEFQHSKHLNNVVCRSISKPEELVSPMQALRRSKTRVDYLLIEKSTLPYLPDNLFRDTHIQEVMIRMTHLGEHAFIGLENVLQLIRAYDVDFTAGLQPDQFRNLKKLKKVYFQGCRMHSVVRSLPSLPELTELKILHSGISSISDDAFRHLPSLTIFGMAYNNLTEMKRSMFPNPAKISYIDLSGNWLSSLPKDFFENMPNLGHVYLNNNKLVTLAEKPFADVFRSNGLVLFYMTGNLLHCDCKLSWLGSVRFPKYLGAICASPEAFSGKSINSLDFESLRLQTCHSGLSELLPASKSFPT